MGVLFSLLACLFFGICDDSVPPDDDFVPTAPTVPNPPPTPTPPTPTPPTPTPPTPTPPTGGGFQITLVNTGSVTTYDALFARAVERWQSVIVGDLADMTTGVSTTDLFQGQLAQTSQQAGVTSVDDLVIGYEFQASLGETTLGFAGPTLLRNDRTPFAGIMVFSAAFFASSTEADNFSTILHEMGHVLGLGPLWPSNLANCDGGCQVNGQGAAYSCSAAAAAYTALRASTSENFGMAELRVSNDGGEGSQCGHWEDDNFNAQNWIELMTPFSSTRAVLLTTVSVASLRDVSSSYVTNEAAADPIPASANEPVTWGIQFPPAADGEEGSVVQRPRVFPTEPKFFSDVLNERRRNHNLRN